MAPSVCPQCGGPISFRESSFAPYLCSKCKADNKRASQAAILGAARRLEDRVFGLLLAPFPKGSRPALERLLSLPRVRGLAKVVGGFALTALIILALYAVGRLTGHWLIPVGAVTALPLAISMVGWVEIVLGIGFTDLANRFDRGGILVKAGILLVVLSVIGLYVWACIRIVNSDQLRRFWW
jgi:hypothetical protein